MNAAQRKQEIATAIRTTFSQENPIFRHITFVYPAADDSNARSPTEVIVDGQISGSVELVVRAAALTSQQEQRLTEKGFVSQTDDDDPRFSTYSTEVENASTDDLVSFVEWVFVVLLNAGDDYVPDIRSIASLGRKRAETRQGGAFKSCISVARAIFWIVVVLTIIGILFSR